MSKTVHVHRTKLNKTNKIASSRGQTTVVLCSTTMHAGWFPQTTKRNALTQCNATQDPTLALRCVRWVAYVGLCCVVCGKRPLHKLTLALGILLKTGTAQAVTAYVNIFLLLAVINGQNRLTNVQNMLHLWYNCIRRGDEHCNKGRVHCLPDFSLTNRFADNQFAEKTLGWQSCTSLK